MAAVKISLLLVGVNHLILLYLHFMDHIPSLQQQSESNFGVYGANKPVCAHFMGCCSLAHHTTCPILHFHPGEKTMHIHTFTTSRTHSSLVVQCTLILTAQYSIVGHI